MTNVAAIPALAILVGCAAGVYVPLPMAVALFAACAGGAWLVVTLAVVLGRERIGLASVAAPTAAAIGFFGAGAALAADARREALAPALLLDTHPYRADIVGAAAAVPLVLTGRIRTDAAATEFGATFTLDVDEVRVQGKDRPTSGGVRVAVGGAFVARQLEAWRAGRRVRAVATLSTPLPYRNIGTPDQEARLALAGIRLFGSVKSAAQVELLAHGRWWEEASASIRALVRRVLAQHVGASSTQDSPAGRGGDSRAPRTIGLVSQDGPDTSTSERTLGLSATDHATAMSLSLATRAPSSNSGRSTPSEDSERQRQSVAIVTAILIGDRAGLDEEVEERLQRAGTFHIIAISGGNVAILTALVLGLLRLTGVPPRTSASATLLVVLLYAMVVGAGASVARATLAAAIYLFARAIDHRTPAFNVLAVVVGIMLTSAPLEIVDPGFWLTCLATFAIMLFTERLAERVAGRLRTWSATAARSVQTAMRTPCSASIGRPAPLLATQAPVWLQSPTWMRIAVFVWTRTPAWLLAMQAPAWLPRPTWMRIGLSRWARTTARRRRRAVRRLISRSSGRVLRASSALFAATVAAEAVLLPVTAYAFFQMSVAGLLLNFIAIPLMTIVQISGLIVVASAGVGTSVGLGAMTSVAELAGRVVDAAARAIVDSARLVDFAPWSASRVAPPPLWLVLASHVCLCLAWWSHPRTRRRRASALAWVTCLALIASAVPLGADLPFSSLTLQPVGANPCRLPAGDEVGDPSRLRDRRDALLRVTVLDVAQGDATLVRLPNSAGAWLIDAGGALGRFDIGARIVSPALWALGVRGLSTLVLTHGDRDHIGGAPAILRDFVPHAVWEGIPVDGHLDLAGLKADAQARGITWESVRAGDAVRVDDGATVRVWHPPPPEWTRVRVRNDDSIVLEIAYGNVSIVLPGDIGSDVERSLASAFARGWSDTTAAQEGPARGSMAVARRRSEPPRDHTAMAHDQRDDVLSALAARTHDERARGGVPGAIRVLKAPHHGSRTSSSAPFIAALAPRVAVVSAGRGNRHGHPAPAVLARYASDDTIVFRTDRDGAIQLDTDGRALVVRTCSGRRLRLLG